MVGLFVCAYYDRSCDSISLFADLEIAKASSFRKHLNKYDVIYLNMTDILGETTPSDLIPFVKRNILRELKDAYPDMSVVEGFGASLVNAAAQAGTKFIMIIDEWDAPIRECPQIQRAYLEFLRSVFKSSAVTSRIFATAYMTGILPIKKDGSQSAVSDFEEFTILEPRDFAEYVGFTEKEVQKLCSDFHRDFNQMKQWYDGYTIGENHSVCNPNSVMKALRSGRFNSYWTETSAAESLLGYIERDYRGLGQTIAQLIGGTDVPVDIYGFANDLVTFRNQDDVLTLLAHLGYLSYDENTRKVHIPNEEIRLEFARTIHQDKRRETMQRVQESDQLILDTVHRNEDAVARQIEKVHMEVTNPLNANNENALRAVIQLAYFSYKDYYLKMEELPAGHGYAGIVYLPQPGEMVPALLVELKWNQSAQAAIAQIRDNKYPEVLRDYRGEILLVGISYDKDAPAGARQYSCRIEPYSQ